MVFRNAGNITSVDKLFYNGRTLEIVDNVSYLGYMFYYNNTFTGAEKRLSGSV